MNWYKKAQNKEPWQMRRNEFFKSRFSGTEPVDIPITKEISDYQTLDEMLMRGLKDGTYVVGDDVIHVRGGKAEYDSTLHATYNWEKNRYELTRTSPQNEILYHGTRSPNVMRASELKPGGRMSGSVPNEYLAIYLTANPETSELFSETDNGKMRTIEARLSPNAKMVSQEEAQKIIHKAFQNNGYTGPEDALRKAGVDAIYKKNRRGVYWEIAVINPSVLQDTDTHRDAIESAMKNGKLIPSEVLEDYPEFKELD